MLKILIVEDEPLLAATLKGLIELNPEHRVTAIARDSAEAFVAAEAERPDLALVDLQLANRSSGFAVAAGLRDLGVASLFTTGGTLSMPVPDLAIGCLAKPYDEAALVHALREAEDIIHGRRKLVRLRRLPEQLEIYGEEPSPPEPAAPASSWLRRRTTWLARMKKLLRSPASFRSAVG